MVGYKTQDNYRNKAKIPVQAVVKNRCHLIKELGCYCVV